MKRPTPPSSNIPPPSTNSESLESMFQPKAGPLEALDVSPFAEPLEPPILGASGEVSQEIKCNTCKNLWSMSLGGQFKNRKPDGSEFILTERYCIFKDSLVTLAERQVLECSRYEEK